MNNNVMKSTGIGKSSWQKEVQRLAELEQEVGLKLWRDMQNQELYNEVVSKIKEYEDKIGLSNPQVRGFLYEYAKGAMENAVLRMPIPPHFKSVIIALLVAVAIYEAVEEIKTKKEEEVRTYMQTNDCSPMQAEYAAEEKVLPWIVEKIAQKAVGIWCDNVLEVMGVSARIRMITGAAWESGAVFAGIQAIKHH